MSNGESFFGKIFLISIILSHKTLEMSGTRYVEAMITVVFTNIPYRSTYFLMLKIWEIKDRIWR